MKKLISIIALGTLLGTTHLIAGKNVVEAEAAIAPLPIDTNPWYVGVGLAWIGVSQDCICPSGEVVRLKDSSWGGILRGGYDYNQYVGIEARAIKSFAGTDWAETTHYGIFLKPMYPIGEQFNIYGLLGYGKTEIDVDCEVMRETFSHSGFSYGIGLEYDLSSKEDDRLEGAYDREFDGHADQEREWGIWVDYQNLIHNEGVTNFKTNIVSFGVTYDF